MQTTVLPQQQRAVDKYVAIAEGHGLPVEASTDADGWTTVSISDRFGGALWIYISTTRFSDIKRVRVSATRYYGPTVPTRKLKVREIPWTLSSMAI